MDNVWDIRRNKTLYFVLSDKKPDNNLSDLQIGIILFLYYEESLEMYFPYIDKIPHFIDIYIVSNNEKIYIEILKLVEIKRIKIKFIHSYNRGRDVSALLVACRDIVLSYEYICYIHDKRKKDYILEEDFNLWIENLWGNLLGGKNYILNVLDLLDRNRKIGLLVPPEPIGRAIAIWYDNAWGENFELVNQLVKEMNLECKLDPDKSPITIGTVFWARSDALKKLFDKNWKYEDFDEEPLKDDGTISHAIERIFGYVAQDAGYDTGTIMCTSYAEKLLCASQEYLSGAYQLLKKTYGISQLENFLKTKELICNFCKENTQIYLYGAGKIGKRCLLLLQTEGYEIEGFIVSDKSKCTPLVEGVSVKEIEEIGNIYKMGIIITVGMKFQEEIENNLKRRGITNYMKYID